MGTQGGDYRGSSRGTHVHRGFEGWMGPYPKGPCTQYLGTWDLENSNYSIGFEEVYEY